MEEDEKLLDAVAKYGLDSWSRIASCVPGRCGKQCRERWLGQLSPCVVKSKWTPEEDLLLLQGHAMHGNRWASIAALLPGRSTITVKNRWNWMLRHNVPQRWMMTPFLVPIVMPMPQTQPRTPPLVLDPVTVETGLFGLHFREFQAEMLS
jgi:hypothetical protein